MIRRSHRPLAALTTLVIAIAGASCRSASVDTSPPIVQPGLPGEPSRTITADEASDVSKVGYTPADVAFMQGMISHHGQAVEMTALLPSRTASEDMKKLAQRIEVSQADEITMMEDWLRRRGQPLPDPHAMHRHGVALMPGMLNGAEMARLADAKGAEFDRLFLEGMIMHHGGALTMVKGLFATPGAGQESEVYAFASDVGADQRMEIDRMGAVLKELQK